MFSSIAGLHPLVPVAPPSWDKTKNVCRPRQVSPEEQNHPRLTAVALRDASAVSEHAVFWRKSGLQLAWYSDAASYSSQHLNPLHPNPQPGTHGHCLIGHPPLNYMSLSKHWPLLRTQSWADCFPCPPLRGCQGSCCLFLLCSPCTGGSILGLVPRLLRTLPSCFHLSWCPDPSRCPITPSLEHSPAGPAWVGGWGVSWHAPLGWTGIRCLGPKEDFLLLGSASHPHVSRRTATALHAVSRF